MDVWETGDQALRQTDSYLHELAAGGWFGPKVQLALRRNILF